MWWSAVAVLAAGRRGRGGRGVADRRPAPATPRSPPRPPPATAEPGVVPVADSAPMPTAAGLTAALAPPLADPEPRRAHRPGHRRQDRCPAVGSRAPTCRCSRRRPTRCSPTAAALLTLDRDARRHHHGGGRRPDREPGVVVLVGGGDPTLSAAPPGQDTWYRGAARISDLADQVRAQRRQARPRCRSTRRVQRPDDGAGLGSRRHRRRRHRPDRGGDARRRPHPAGQRRVARGP